MCDEYLIPSNEQYNIIYSEMAQPIFTKCIMHGTSGALNCSSLDSLLSSVIQVHVVN